MDFIVFRYLTFLLAWSPFSAEVMAPVSPSKGSGRPPPSFDSREGISNPHSGHAENVGVIPGKRKG